MGNYVMSWTPSAPASSAAPRPTAASARCAAISPTRWGCRVVAGAGDNAAVAVGTGTVGDGNCIISLGTSGTIFISSERFGVDPNNALHAFAHAGGGWHLMGCMLSAASCNKWLCDEIYLTDD